jgi:hypothetical protein
MVAGLGEKPEQSNVAAKLRGGPGVLAHPWAMLRDRMDEEARSRVRVVHSEVDLKHWMEKLPDVEAARPGRYPCCGAAGRPSGAPVGLVGHGVRARQLLGPRWREAAPEAATVMQRRYRCRQCEAVIVVQPAEVLPRRRYAAAAIALALALYGIDKQPAPRVRRLVSPWRIVGATAAATWATLLRWDKAVRAKMLFESVRRCPTDWSLRQVAERAATTLASYAQAADRGANLVCQAVAGAAWAAMASVRCAPAGGSSTR